MALQDLKQHSSSQWWTGSSDLSKPAEDLEELEKVQVDGAAALEWSQE